MMEIFNNAFVQVSVDSLYLTDYTYHAVFANDRGQFSSFQLNNGGHYEVHGDGMAEEMLPNAAGGRLLLKVQFQHFLLRRDHRRIRRFRPLLTDQSLEHFRGEIPVII
jgi:hypothetical protein